MVLLHRMDTASLVALKPKWAKMFGPESGQVRRLQHIISLREVV